MIVAGTGHRPDKLGGYLAQTQRALERFALLMLPLVKPSGVISGMAQGWDQALAVACVRLGIPFVAAIPFEGQESRWPRPTQENYRRLLQCASYVHVVNERDAVAEGGVPWAMQKRNEWMVDNSTKLLALWNGDRSGGTFNCIEYARLGRREIVNVWPQWDAIQSLV